MDKKTTLEMIAAISNANGTSGFEDEVVAVKKKESEKIYEECRHCRDKFFVPSGGFEVVRKYLRENK